MEVIKVNYSGCKTLPAGKYDAHKHDAQGKRYVLFHHTGWYSVDSSNIQTIKLVRVIDIKNIPKDRLHVWDDDYKDISADFESDKIDGLTPFLHNGFLYSPRWYKNDYRENQENYAICHKTKLTDLNNINSDYTSNITCPYCGNENIDSWEAEDCSEKEECSFCNSTYSYERYVTVEYCSEKVEKYELKEIE